MRLYFVLLGRASASSSCRNEWNSCSASSSRVNGFDGLVVLCDAAAGSWIALGGSDGGISALLEPGWGSGVDHSQPIVYISCKSICERVRKFHRGSGANLEGFMPTRDWSLASQPRLMTSLPLCSWICWLVSKGAVVYAHHLYLLVYILVKIPGT